MYLSGSPLRVIPHVERGSPHTPGDRSDEDREVETTMTALPSCPRQVCITKHFLVCRNFFFS